MLSQLLTLSRQHRQTRSGNTGCSANVMCVCGRVGRRGPISSASALVALPSRSHLATPSGGVAVGPGARAMSRSTPMETLSKRNAIMAYYLGGVKPRDIARMFPGAGRARVQAAVLSMPPGLRQSTNYRELERAANLAAGHTEGRGAYTDTEFNEAMVARITNAMSGKEVAAR